MTHVPRTEEGRVGAVAAGGTINGTYGLPPGEALEAFRADLRVLVGRPTEDAWKAANRALNWRTAELRAHGLEPIRIPMDAPHYPPEGFDFHAANPRQPAPDLGFVDRSEGGSGRTSIKKSHRAEGRNFVD